LVLANEDLVRDALFGAFNYCGRGDRKSDLSLLVDRYARLDGSIVLESLEAIGTSFRIGGVHYRSIDELVDACMIPIYAAAKHDWWLTNACRQASTIPLLSNIVISIAMYPLVRAHEEYPSTTGGTMVVHPHWGAAGMAGFPPMSRGYFASKITRVRKCFRMLLDAPAISSQIPSVVYLLAPAAIFLLTSMSNETLDQDLLDDVLRKVQRCLDGAKRSVPPQTIVDSVILPWLQENEKKLSSYWRRRFQLPGNPSSAGFENEIRHPVVYDSLLDIPMRTLCMVVGSFQKHFGKKI
jgi:hypothetical protein